ncbi:MAG: response regulator [Anaerolineales bacterium]
MLKILLLEDDHDMNMLLQILLKIEGYQVWSYDPKRPVLEQAEEKIPDLVLLDVHLGGLDGIQILREIRQTPALGEVRVVMTSGINVSEECLRDGANAFIVKPYMPERLLEILRGVLASPVDQKFREENPKPSSVSYQKFL